MTDWLSGDVSANGIRVHYTRTGGTKPALVLAHGVTDDGPCWTAVAEALAGEYDIIMVDARGHGYSEAPERGYELATMAADLRGVISALGLQKPAILGHSMGAITGLALAGIYPDVPGVVLAEDPPPWWITASDTAQDEQQRREGMHSWLLELKKQTRDELIDTQRHETPGWSEAELGPWADSKLRVSPNVVHLFDPGVATSVNWSACLPHITCPMLLITADPSLRSIVTADAAERLRALVPQLRVAHIPRAGHSIHRDQFQPYIEVVRKYLAER